MKKTRSPKRKPESRKLPPLESVGYPRPLYGDLASCLYDIPGYRSLGRKGSRLIPLEAKELIPIPEEAILFSLPGREPLIWKKDTVEHLPSPLTAVGASLPEGYIVRSLAAYQPEKDREESLPPLAYGALACWQNKNWVAAAKLKKREPLPLPKRYLLSPDAVLQSFSPKEAEEVPDEKWELVILFCPGVTDSEVEWNHWLKFFNMYSPSSIRLENLTCDWDSFFSFIADRSFGDTAGPESFLQKMRELLPEAQVDEIEIYWGS